LESYRFELPEELIAKEPVEPRDQARLLVYHRNTGEIEHKFFYQLPEVLPPNTVLVANTSKVFMARTFAQKVDGKSNVEVLFVRDCKNKEWNVLMRPAKRVKVGQRVSFIDGSEAELLRKENGVCTIRWEHDDPYQFFETHGALPLPPYLQGSKAERQDYQTVYANQIGSAAAPTAGLHFTESLWQKLSEQHQCLEVCLHVGLGTFKPIQDEDIRQHPIHEEYIEVSSAVAQQLTNAKKDHYPICAIGTTSLRTLESVYTSDVFAAYQGTTKLFLYPGKAPKAVDMLITNFHTPESSLLALVASIVGLDEVHRIYTEAIKHKYRFFSFGDAMIIL